MGKMLFPAAMTTTLGQHFLMVPLTLFTMVVPLPFGALGVSEEAGNQLGKLVGHPSGALAMLAFRVLMYSCGLISACVYLANLREVRSLTAEAHHLEEELEEGIAGRGWLKMGSAEHRGSLSPSAVWPSLADARAFPALSVIDEPVSLGRAGSSADVPPPPASANFSSSAGTAVGPRDPVRASGVSSPSSYLTVTTRPR